LSDSDSSGPAIDPAALSQVIRRGRDLQAAWALRSGTGPGIWQQQSQGIDTAIHPGIDTATALATLGSNTVIDTGIDTAIHPGIDTATVCCSNPVETPPDTDKLNVEEALPEANDSDSSSEPVWVMPAQDIGCNSRPGFRERGGRGARPVKGKHQASGSSAVPAHAQPEASQVTTGKRRRKCKW
jgi:hypothetical protein